MLLLVLGSCNLRHTLLHNVLRRLRFPRYVYWLIGRLYFDVGFTKLIWDELLAESVNGLVETDPVTLTLDK